MDKIRVPRFFRIRRTYNSPNPAAPSAAKPDTAPPTNAPQRDSMSPSGNEKRAASAAHSPDSLPSQYSPPGHFQDKRFNAKGAKADPGAKPTIYEDYVPYGWGDSPGDDDPYVPYQSAVHAESNHSFGSLGDTKQASATVASLMTWAKQRVSPEESDERAEIVKLLAQAADIDLKKTPPYQPVRLKRPLFLYNMRHATGLPNVLMSDSDVTIEGCSALRGLPKTCWVKGSLRIVDCPSISRLDDEIKVGGDFTLERADGLEYIGASIFVRQNFDVKDCYRLQSIGPGLQVAGDFYVFDCPGLHELGAQTTVGCVMHLRGLPQLSSLPEQLRVKFALKIQMCPALRGRLQFQSLGQGGPLVSVIRNLGGTRPVSLDNLMFIDSLELMFDNIQRADRYKMVSSVQEMLFGREHVFGAAIHQIFHDFSKIPPTRYADVVRRSAAFPLIMTRENFQQFADHISGLCKDVMAESQEKAKAKAKEQARQRDEERFKASIPPPARGEVSEAARLASARVYLGQLRQAPGTRAVLTLIDMWSKDPAASEVLHGLAEHAGRVKQSSAAMDVRWLDAIVGTKATAAEAKRIIKIMTLALHPDKLPRQSDEFGEDAMQLAKSIFLICEQARQQLAASPK